MEKNMWQTFEPTPLVTNMATGITNRQAALFAAVINSAGRRVDSYIVVDAAEEFLAFLEADNG